MTCRSLIHKADSPQRAVKRWVLGAMLCAWLWAASPALVLGQEPEAAPPPDLLEGIEDPPAEEPPTEPEETPAEPLNSIEGIASQMQRVESRLREADSGEATQEMQEEIIAALDAFIEEMRKSGGGGTSSGGQPGAGQSGAAQPSGQSSDTPGEAPESPEDSDSPGEESEAEGNQQGEEQERDPEEALDESTERAGHETTQGVSPLESRPNLLRQAWGHLPSHAAEAMPNAATEQFLPRYQREIESYFRRLNEEQPSDSL